MLSSNSMNITWHVIDFKLEAQFFTLYRIIAFKNLLIFILYENSITSLLSDLIFDVTLIYQSFCNSHSALSSFFLYISFCFFTAFCVYINKVCILSMTRSMYSIEEIYWKIVSTSSNILPLCVAISKVLWNMHGKIFTRSKLEMHFWGLVVVRAHFLGCSRFNWILMILL